MEIKTYINFEKSEQYCTSRAIIDKLQNHSMIINGFLKTEHIKKELDQGDFGWVLFKFNTTSALLIFFKALIVEEYKQGMILR